MTREFRVGVNRILRTLRLVIFLLVVRPSQASQCVRFKEVPRRFLNVSRRITSTRILKDHLRARHLILLFATNVHAKDRRNNAPFHFASWSAFIACPACVVTRGNDRNAKLRAASNEGSNDPIVFLLLSVEAFAVNAIRPSFIRLAVINRRFNRLFSGRFVMF